MSWLDCIEYDWEYQCDSCGCVTKKRGTEKANPLPPCDNCGKETYYIGFKSIGGNGTLRVSYEQNGRVGYRITTDKGTTYMSKSKYDYMKTGKNKSHLTREYEKHVQDQQQEEFGKYKKTLETSATVTSATKASVGEDNG